MGLSGFFAHDFYVLGAVVLQPFLPGGWGFCLLKKFPGGQPGGGGGGGVNSCN